METQLVASLGVKMGGTATAAEPVETIRSQVTTGREDAFTESGALKDTERGAGSGGGPHWTGEAEARLARVPTFVRGMVQKIYADYSKERGIAAITPVMMDRARTEMGLEEMSTV